MSVSSSSATTRPPRLARPCGDLLARPCARRSARSATHASPRRSVQVAPRLLHRDRRPGAGSGARTSCARPRARTRSPAARRLPSKRHQPAHRAAEARSRPRPSASSSETAARVRDRRQHRGQHLGGGRPAWCTVTDHVLALGRLDAPHGRGSPRPCRRRSRAAHCVGWPSASNATLAAGPIASSSEIALPRRRRRCTSTREPARRAMRDDAAAREPQRRRARRARAARAARAPAARSPRAAPRRRSRTAARACSSRRLCRGGALAALAPIARSPCAVAFDAASSRQRQPARARPRP